MTVCSILNTGYDPCNTPSHLMYHVKVIAYMAMTGRFVNQVGACLLYGNGYHCGCELVVFAHTNIFIN